MRSYISFESEATFPWVGSGILSGWSDRFAGRSTLHTGFHLSSWTDGVVRGALTAEWWSEFGAGCELRGDHGGAEGAWSTSASKWGAGGSWARWGNCLKMFMLWILLSVCVESQEFAQIPIAWTWIAPQLVSLWSPLSWRCRWSSDEEQHSNTQKLNQCNEVTTFVIAKKAARCVYCWLILWGVWFLDEKTASEML